MSFLFSGLQVLMILNARFKSELKLSNKRLQSTVINYGLKWKLFLLLDDTCSYLLNNYKTLAIQNNELCHLPPQDHKQLKSFLELLQNQNIAGNTKKRRITAEHDEVFTE